MRWWSYTCMQVATKCLPLDTLHDQKYGPLLIKHLIPKSWALIWSCPPLAAITASTLLGRLSTRCWNIAAGTYFYSDLTLCTAVLSCWNRKGPSSNSCHKVGSTDSSRMWLYAVADRFTFTGTKGPSPNHEKQPQTIIPPPPNFIVGTMHSGM